MKTRYFIKLSYKGAGYHGWQIQPKALTVQAVLNRDMSIILGEPVETTGAGRTDTGVHARVFFAHFDSEQDKLDSDQKLIWKINGILPGDISVHRIYKVSPEAHARYSALSRTYEYHIIRVKDPFLPEFAHSVYRQINTRQIIETTRILFEYTDFTSFSRVDTDVSTFICKIIQAEWSIDESSMVFTITADRFLRNMVRAIVGTMLDVGLGRTSPDGFRKIIESRDRTKAGSSAPAKGLFLTGIEYPESIFNVLCY
jgi:tRNA pseudouridine38-40 synthase